MVHFNRPRFTLRIWHAEDRSVAYVVDTGNDNAWVCSRSTVDDGRDWLDLAVSDCTAHNEAQP